MHVYITWINLNLKLFFLTEFNAFYSCGIFRLIKTEATLVGQGFLSFCFFSLGVSFLDSLDLLTSTAVSAVFIYPSISGCSSHVIAPF